MSFAAFRPVGRNVFVKFHDKSRNSVNQIVFLSWELNCLNRFCRGTTRFKEANILATKNTCFNTKIPGFCIFGQSAMWTHITEFINSLIPHISSNIFTTNCHFILKFIH